MPLSPYSTERERWNGARFRRDSPRGHYESWFQRANHPSRPLAFWIRYTIFSPRGRPEATEGELWAIWFDGEARRVVAVKQDHPLERCHFATSGLDTRIGDATLDGAGLRGEAASHGHALAWELRYQASEPPLLLLPHALYDAPLPKAKAVVGSPLAHYDGALTIDGERHSVEGWVGSQNHNWGSQHTDRYAWGQVAGFEDAPDAFLELSTAQVRVGPVLTPRMTPLVLRLGGREHALNALGTTLRARARYDLFQWSFATRGPGIEISGSIAAPAWSFVALPYRNPPGGTKTCLNSKIARCDLTVRVGGGAARTLTTAHRAAFEILTDSGDHGVPLLGER
ncbi:MAG: hypothetical protein IT376_22765 [Polyangiaceae bacterium]|nr:hypothetical protein [Polyangiaceae bacterium]